MRLKSENITSRKRSSLSGLQLRTLNWLPESSEALLLHNQHDICLFQSPNGCERGLEEAPPTDSVKTEGRRNSAENREKKKTRCE